MVFFLIAGFSQQVKQADSSEPQKALNVRPNVVTSFNSEASAPDISAKAYVDPQSAVIGKVHLGDNVYVAPFASVRGDEGTPIWIGSNTNIQDGVIIHALETQEHGQSLEKNLMEVEGKKYAVYVGNHVSLAHQCQVHGPSVVEDDSFIGMQAFVFKSRVGKNCVVEPGAKLIGVNVADNHYVPAGLVVTTQAEADKLPVITDDYIYKDLNKDVVHVNEQLAENYLKQSRGN